MTVKLCPVPGRSVRKTVSLHPSDAPSCTAPQHPHGRTHTLQGMTPGRRTGILQWRSTSRHRTHPLSALPRKHLSLSDAARTVEPPDIFAPQRRARLNSTTTLSQVDAHAPWHDVGGAHRNPLMAEPQLVPHPIIERAASKTPVVARRGVHGGSPRYLTTQRRARLNSSTPVSLFHWPSIQKTLI